MNALYTSIDQKDGLDAIKWALENKSNLKKKQRDFILSLLELPMEINYFWYNKKFFQQLKGVAMGAKCTSRVANLTLEESVT